MASLVAQMVKNLPAMRETRVRSLGWEDPLEEGIATHSDIRAWRIPQRRLADYSSCSGRVEHARGTNTHTCIYIYVCVHVCVYLKHSILSLLHSLVVVVLQCPWK